MAAYGSGYYGGGNYSYGVSLGEAALAGVSSVTAAGTRFTFGEVLIAASSSVAANAIVVKDAAFAVSASSASTAAGQRLAISGATVASSSSVSASGLRYAVGAAAISNAYVATPYDAFGNAQLSTAQQKFGASSIAFDGSGDYVKSPTTVSPFENSDYTVEMWVRPNASSSSSYIFDHRQGGGVSLRTSSTSLWVGVGGYIAINISGAFPTPQVWYHIAITRAGNSTKCFINGVQKGSTYTTGYTASAASIFLGAPYFATSTFFNGYIDEFRVSNVARYTSAFTPPTAAFAYDLNTLVLLHADGANGSTVIEDSIDPPAILIDGVRYAVGAANILPTSASTTAAQRIAFVSASVGSQTTIVVGSNVIVNQSLIIESTSTSSVDSRSIIDFACLIADTSSMTCFARLKWEDEADTAESWTTQPDTAESWTPVAGAVQTWTTQPDTAESWTQVSDNTEIWQIAA